MSNDFLREVDDLVRAERLKSAWDNFKFWIIGGVVAVIVFIMGYHFIADYRESKQDKQALAYWSLTQTPDEQAQFNILNELAKDADMGYRTLAKFHLAGYWIAHEDEGKAAEVYASIYGDRAVPTTLADVARLMRAQLLLESDAAESEKLLKQLVGNNSAYAGSALEFLGAQAENQGNAEQAKSYYEQMLQKADLTPDLRARAQARIAALGVQAAVTE